MSFDNCNLNFVDGILADYIGDFCKMYGENGVAISLVIATDTYGMDASTRILRGGCISEDMTERFIKKIKTRTAKTRAEQYARSKSKAEVFTPSWLCEKMVNICIDDVATTSEEETISKTVLEMCCGEAPFIVSRYDATTGEDILNLDERIGWLDRKLQLVNRISETKDEWICNAKVAYETTYGYEWQADNLIIARANLLLSFIDYYSARWKEPPEKSVLDDVVERIIKNFIQMDGLKHSQPITNDDVCFYRWGVTTQVRTRKYINYKHIHYVNDAINICKMLEDGDIRDERSLSQLKKRAKNAIKNIEEVNNATTRDFSFRRLLSALNEAYDQRFNTDCMIGQESMFSYADDRSE